ncbi:MAG: hypothetical protein QOE33_3117 [Acidobacteriota bacterium]|nr:hypothetical protein [Acidobacteriota bacterium]
MLRATGHGARGIENLDAEGLIRLASPAPSILFPVNYEISF